MDIAERKWEWAMATGCERSEEKGRGEEKRQALLAIRIPDSLCHKLIKK
jgi:hypothetical protein